MTLRVSNSVQFDLIEESTLSGVGWELHVHDRDVPATRLSIINRWRSFSISKVLSDAGAGQTQFDFDDPQLSDALIQSTFVNDENLIRFVRNGVSRFAMFPEDPDEEHVTQEEERGYRPSGRGPALYLEWSTVVPPNYPLHTSLQWTWAETPPMAAWLDLFNAAVARGNLCGLLIPTFTATHDSAGIPWASTMNMEVNPGGDLLALLRRFAEAAEAEWVVTPDLRIDVRQNYGFHRENQVRFFITESQITNVVKRTRRGIANTVYTVAANEAVPFVQDAASAAKWGRRELLVQTANARDSGTAQTFGRILLNTTKDELVSFTIKVRPDSPGREVFIDYDVGDWVWVEGQDVSLSDAFKVQAIAFAVDEDGNEDLELTMAAKRNLRLVEIQKRFEREAGSSLRVESELIIGNKSTGGGAAGLTKISVSEVDLGSHAPASDYTWLTVLGATARMMVVRFQITSGGSLNWAVQVNSKAGGLGERMFEAVGIGSTEYNCSWPWWYENQEDPQQSEMYIGIKNIAGALSAFTLVDLRAESLVG